MAGKRAGASMAPLVFRPAEGAFDQQQEEDDTFYKPPPVAARGEMHTGRVLRREDVLGKDDVTDDDTYGVVAQGLHNANAEPGLRLITAAGALDDIRATANSGAGLTLFVPQLETFARHKKWREDMRTEVAEARVAKRRPNLTPPPDRVLHAFPKMDPANRELLARSYVVNGLFDVSSALHRKTTEMGYPIGGLDYDEVHHLPAQAAMDAYAEAEGALERGETPLTPVYQKTLNDGVAISIQQLPVESEDGKRFFAPHMVMSEAATGKEISTRRIVQAAAVAPDGIVYTYEGTLAGVSGL
jgi:hypothetical protein